MKEIDGDLMDWSKAKSILIVALIVTNSLLGYVLFVDQNNVDATIQSEFIEETVILLNNKNIKLETEIPTINPNLFGLTVEYEILDIATLNDNFFQGKGIVETKGEGLLEISYEDQLLTIINKKFIIYESKSEEIKFDSISEQQAIEMAKEFIKDNGFIITDIELSFIKEVDGVYNIEFTKVVDGNFMEATFTNVQLDNRGIRKLERIWLNMNNIGANPIYISSAPKSILALLSMEEVYGKTIKEISLCYYFDPEKHEYIENPGEAQQGRAVPAWRVQFVDGYKVFIDNY